MTRGSDAASCRDCSDLAEPVEHVVGLCRRRRTLSKRLTFLDIEPMCATALLPSQLVAAAPELIQLVCEWQVPAGVAVGMRIQAAGIWETQQRATSDGDQKAFSERTGRFCVAVDSVEVVEDCRGESAWHNAAEGATWRARIRQQGGGDAETSERSGSPGPSGHSGPSHVSGTGLDKRGGSAGEGPVEETSAVMCLTWADAGRCADPTCAARHAAATPWETRRRDRAAARRQKTRSPGVAIATASDTSCGVNNSDGRHGGGCHDSGGWGGIALDDGSVGGLSLDGSVQLNASQPIVSDGQHGGSGNASKSKHNLVFCRWLVDTFGVDALRRCPSSGGEGVIDIAGGRGMLSLELALTHHVRATLVEPKPLRLNKAYQRRVKKWRQRRSEAECVGAAEAESDSSADNRDRDWDKDGGVPSVALAESENRPRTRSNTHVADQSQAADLDMPVHHVQAEFHGLGGSADAVIAAVRTAGTILGMHPDAPTGHIVDAALTLGKSFAVVPCCVFASLFPERRTPAGSLVSTYEELLDYLQAKSPDIQRAELACEGRRVVLFRRSHSLECLNPKDPSP
uniref:C3H1-type domain-containing protein n=1 Tax=Mantoniella antarctica TaxID=81844 RepID=A0A7S0T091_9CHLO|mmetsp:Transcript_39036/g.96622  ORF Transcript_39036/g.96622 Transcript_39036/m.96622 type:complete len:571 (+) Transcript_39036:93-1805(+)